MGMGAWCGGPDMVRGLKWGGGVDMEGLGIGGPDMRGLGL